MAERVVFMGTPEFGVPSLQALIKAGYEIVGIYTQPDRPSGRGRGVVESPVKQVAREHGLPIFQPASLRDPEEIERLRQLAPDAIVVAAFGQFLPKAVLEIPPFKCINVHPSHLPRYRGPSPISYAILNGDEETAVSIMVLTSKMDAGPILAQRRVPIEPEDTMESLRVRLAQVGAEVLVETLPRWLRGEITPQPQDESQATLSRMITKEQGFLDWGQPAVVLARVVRAFQPWPGAYTKWRGKILKIIEATPCCPAQRGAPGTALALDPPEEGSPLGIQTGEGILVLKTVQLEGRKVVSAGEFLRGQRGIVGETLPS